jgi:alanine racemase
MSRPTKIIIDLQAIKHNCQLAASVAAKSSLVAMVKADAYGHGASEVAKVLESQVAKFGVCCLEEALALRQAGISKPIVLIEGCFEVQEYELAAQLNCELVIHNEQQISQILALDSDVKFTLWLKIDTGMHRLGLTIDSTETVYKQLLDSNKVTKVILMSHFANADELESPFTLEQMQGFNQIARSLLTNHSSALDISLANSAAILAWPQSHGDWVRPGIMLYGISPFSQEHENAGKLKPAMQFCSKVIAIRQVKTGEYVGYANKWQALRPSVIATVAAGYGDGYPRNAASGTPVLVKGQVARLAGRVSMDMLSVDVTDLTNISVGDDVELWGNKLSVNEVAQHAGTNGYELVTRMPSRTPRSFR